MLGDHLQDQILQEVELRLGKQDPAQVKQWAQGLQADKIALATILLQRSQHGLYQLIPFREGLQDQAIGTLSQRFHRDLDRAKTGHDHDRQVGLPATRPVDQFEAVHAGHANICQQQIHLAALQDLQALPGVGDRNHL